ncbi:MAG: monovalent cation/H+ antiporter subunit D family protein [Acetobacteraceae bacterium]|nr:monovalent cation/H+ antiporter subunit D family protein [Acetobacteraceae bacterium]
MNTMVVAMAVPVVGAIVIALLRRLPVARDIVLVVTAVAMFGVVLTLLPLALSGIQPSTPALTILPGLVIQLVVEPLGMLFALVASGLWIASALYAIGYMRGNDEPRQTGFHACFALSLAATLGVAFAGNLFTLFLFYEVLTLVTYPLVTHKRDEAAIAAGRLYLIMLVGASLMLFLPAIAWVALATGGGAFEAGGTLTASLGAGTLSPAATGLLLALFVFGIGKAAVMPGHRWLPAAMVAPTPVSALLHAVAVVKSGVFCIVKIVVTVFGVETLARLGTGDWLAYGAGTTVILSSLIAMRQDDLKRRLAYSTISQLSYVVLAVSLFTPVATMAATLHIVAHAFGKITLFFAAGAIYTAAHKTKISELDGIGRLMPWTMTAFAIGALAMIGVPPTAGFVSKWFLVSAALTSAHWFALGVVVVSTGLTAGYFLPIIHAAFLRDRPDDDHVHGEAPPLMVIALTTTAVATIVVCLFPGPFLTLARLLAGLA